MEQRIVNTWEEFKEQLDDLRQWHDGSLLGSLLFRGQENAEWSLTTTLDRKRELMPYRDYYRIIHRIKHQVESFTDKPWPIPDYQTVLEWLEDYDLFSLQLTSEGPPGYDYMAYLRHHGFPSPLLDWAPVPIRRGVLRVQQGWPNPERKGIHFRFLQYPGESFRKPNGRCPSLRTFRENSPKALSPAERVHPMPGVRRCLALPAVSHGV
jgi:hypothetical protein